MGRRTVLIAVDESPQAEATFNWYFSDARREDDSLILLHCWEMPYMQGLPLRSEVADDLIEKAQKEAEGVDKKYKELLSGKQVEARFIGQFGHPGHLIVETAAKENVTVIILGTRGMGTLRRTVLGSVSDYVVHHAHCPVVVCRH